MKSPEGKPRVSIGWSIGRDEGSISDGMNEHERGGFGNQVGGFG